MTKNYIVALIKMFPKISNGRKNYNLFEERIKLNLQLTKKYKKNKISKNIK